MIELADRDLPAIQPVPLAPEVLASRLRRDPASAAMIEVNRVLAGREVLLHEPTRSRIDVGAWWWSPSVHLLITRDAVIRIAWLDWTGDLRFASDERPVNDLGGAAYNHATGELALGKVGPLGRVVVLKPLTVRIHPIAARRVTALLSALTA